MEPFLSIIVPVFNESGRIHNISIISEYLDRQEFTGEIIIVNDGGTDHTPDVLENTLSDHYERLISYEPNRGKGHAIREGMLAATGKFRLFTDIDLSTPIDEFNNFLPHLDEHDIIIGSRRVEGALLARRQSTIRETLGRGFTYLSQKILQLTVLDFTCGFKCVSKTAAEKIFPRMTIDRWAFDSELLYIAKIKGLSIKEIPVTWENDPHTKVRFPHDLVRSFVDLLQIRLNDLRKVYD